MPPLSRQNNFDFMRLLFAVFVMVSHSYWVTGSYKSEILLSATGGQIDLGALGVKGFFIVSGFLIFQSLERSRSIFDFLRKRFLRIFPALVVMCIVVMLVVPFFYSGGGSIFRQRTYWLFPAKALSLYWFKIYIAGVFATHPNKEINTPLWSLCYEFTCYLLLALLFFVRKPKVRLALVLLAFYATWYLASFKYYWLNGPLFSHLNMYSYYFYDLACFFLSGAVLSFFVWKNIRFRYVLIMILVCLVLLSLHYQVFYFTKYAFLPIIVILFGTGSIAGIRGLGDRFGDLSYGVYIYGWLIQQMLYALFSPGVLSISLLAIPLAFLAGWLSWKFVEKPALRFKQFRI